MSPLLDVRHLTVSFPTIDGLVQAVRGVSFSVDTGRTLGIVGESGCGKSVTALTLMGLSPGADISGEAYFDGNDLLNLSSEGLRQLRGAEIAMIFQDPLSSLHPYYKVGWQIVEAIRAHERMSRKAARRRAIELLGMVGIPQPDRRVDSYPHEFSGGMRQRAMIAMALALNPRLVIADEPTTALDATIQAQIIDLLVRLQRESDTALIMITHDLGIIAEIADEVMVMYAGEGVEYGDRNTVYYRTHHPYTKGLLESIPGALGHKDRLRPIVGQPPSLLSPPTGCTFHPRCFYAMDRCLTDPPPLRHAAGGVDHESACWLPLEAIGRDASSEALRAEAVAAGRGAAARKVAARRDGLEEPALDVLPAAESTDFDIRSESREAGS